MGLRTIAVVTLGLLVLVGFATGAGIAWWLFARDRRAVEYHEPLQVATSARADRPTRPSWRTRWAIRRARRNEKKYPSMRKRGGP